MKTVYGHRPANSQYPACWHEWATKDEVAKFCKTTHVLVAREVSETRVVSIR